MELHLLSPSGMACFGLSLMKEGVNLMALLHFTNRYYPHRIAVSNGKQTRTYADLYKNAKLTASYLYHQKELVAGKRVAILCSNNIELLYCLFGLSYIGAHAYLLNLDMSNNQLSNIISQKKIDFYICDTEREISINSNLKSLSTKTLANYLKSNECTTHKPIKRKRFRQGELVVLTGGTSGKYKSAARKPSVFNFINPFFALIEQIGIHRYESVYIAPPIYHGFGLAAVIVTLLIGKTLFIRPRFSAEEANKLIHDNKINLLVAVPTMLRRILENGLHKPSSLRCILSGGAPLDEKLVHKAEESLGEVLYNLYGTSEAGFFILATPQDLHQYPLCLGRPIKGVKTKIVHQDDKGVGILHVKSAWAMDHAQNTWQSTGDRAMIDGAGLIFLRGRADNMIVSGGENVYPEDVEQVLLSHPQIKEAIVVSIDTEDFGQRLHACIVTDEPMNQQDIIEWLKPRIARFQMPYSISVEKELPTLSTGKIALNKLFYQNKSL